MKHSVERLGWAPGNGANLIATLLRGLASLALLVLVSSKEALWLRPYLGNKGFDALVAVLFAAYFVGLFTSIERGSFRIRFRPQLVFPRVPGLLFLILVASAFIVYLGFHELVIDDRGRSLKFIVYLVFLISLLTYNANLQRISRCFVWLGCIISLSLVLQHLLIVGVADNNLDVFSQVNPASVEGRLDGYVNPFGLGLLRKYELIVQYGPISFYREFSFTTESKYCSILLLVSLFCALMTEGFSYPARCFIIGSLLIGLWLCHAYASFAVLLIAIFIALLGKRLSTMALLGLVLFALSGFIALALSKQISLSEYMSERLTSFLYTVILPAKGLAADGTLPWGLGFRTTRSCAGLVLQLVRYGYLGLILQLLMLAVFLRTCLRSIRMSTSFSRRFGFSIAFGLVLAFLGFFSSEFISPLFSFVYGMVFRYSVSQETREPRLAISSDRPASLDNWMRGIVHAASRSFDRYEIGQTHRN